MRLLGRLKWPAITAVVLGGCWLLSDSGVGYLHARWSFDAWSAQGADAEAAAANEARLTYLGGFLMNTMRFELAEDVMVDAMRYEGENYWYNLYRLAKVKEKLEQPEAACEILGTLMEENVNSRLDRRVPGNDVLDLRRSRLLEVHELGAEAP